MPTVTPATPRVLKFVLSFGYLLATPTRTLGTFSACNQLHQHPATHADQVAAAKPKQKRTVLATVTYPTIALGWQLQQPPTDWQLQQSPKTALPQAPLRPMASAA